jgi:hypothetical protein
MADDPQEERRKNPARKRDRSSIPAPAAETARQEGAQGRTGKSPADTLSDGQVDSSDPNAVT